MANGFGILGAALGGDSEQAYQEGRAIGAKTEDALASARRRVMENDALARGRDTLIKAGVPEADADAAYTALQAGGKLNDPIQTMLGKQEFDFRAKAGDPNVPLDVGQRSLLGVSSAPVEPLYKVGGGYGNKFDSGAGITPLGDAFDAGGGSSATVQAWRAYGILDENGRIKPGQEALAYEIQRNTDKVFDKGGVPEVRSGNPFGPVRAFGPQPPAAAPAPTGAPAPTAAPAPAAAAPAASAPLASVDEVARNTAAIASAKEQGSAQGKNAASLPTAVNTIDAFSKDIDNLVASPGFDSIYGARVANPVIGGVVQFASQDASNADALRNKINAESFRASINSMRGLGQLSNAEGEKVQAALTTLANPKIDPGMARQAAADLKIRLNELKRVAQIEAGQAHVAPGTPPTGAPAPAAGPEPTATAADGRKVVYRNGQWQPL